MEWTELHDLNLCEEVLVVEPWKHPYRSKERGDSWNEIANNLNASDHPTFKVSKRSVRDRLTLLQQKYKAKMRMEEAASGIDCQETKLDKALEEIIEKEKAATDARSLQDDNNKKTENAAAKEHRNRAVERLGETKKRNAEKQDEKAQTAKKGRRSTSEVVQFLKEKSERESVLRKEDLELRRKELSQKEDMMKMLAQQEQQQTQLMLCLLAKGQNKNS